MRTISKKRQADLPRRRAVRDAAFERDGGCVLRHLTGHSCGGGWTPHHLLKASQGGLYDEENILTLCAQANTAVEDEPDWGWSLGLVVRRGETHADALDRRQRAGLVPRTHPYVEGEPF